MQYRRLGRTGLDVSAVSIGGAYLAGPDADRIQENATALVRRALELGVNYIDTAPLYGDSETLLGQALKGVQQPFYLSSKIGFKPEGFDYKRDSVLRSIERSLGLLGLEKLAVAQIHEVNLAGWERIVEPGGTLEGLRAAQARGWCDYIGITGRAIPLLARLAATGEFDTLLVYHDYHPCLQLAAREVLPTAAAQDMGVVAATVLAGGLYVDGQEEEGLGRLEDEAARGRCRGILARLREEDSTLPQSAFRYVLGDDRVSTVSSGAATLAQLEEVLRAGDMAPLPGAEIGVG
ncbi:MAG: hypothetical protein GKR89_21560 [Candidatus Latescibacteria bacterium]|nr:hypothetical protein [Candidatus Latescibacterota bacterium]